MIDLFASKENSKHLPPISEAEMSDEEVLVELKKIKEELKNEVVVLGHHYQQDDIISFADYTGDSLQLAREAAKLSNPYIMFCGVHFMAETADMLSAPHQKVILPDLQAGCSMADMAKRKDIDRAWSYLTASTSEKIIPVTYINCAATLKAFVGDHGGSICTSSNAKEVVKWALNEGDKLLFFPDQHLGRNTCYTLGIPLDQMVIYDPRLQNGGLTPDAIHKAKIILWYGLCSVHQGFTKEQIMHIKKTAPQMEVIVHPECTFEVVMNADDFGSTSYIIEKIAKAKSGSAFAVGTEINLVNRLQQWHPDKKIISLSPYQCLCTTMYRIRPRWLLASFNAIKKQQPINVITVSEEIKESSMKALARMLSIK